MPETFELTSPLPIEELTGLGDVGEFFSLFIELLYTDLVKSGIAEKSASTITGKVASNMSLAFAGQTFYVTNKPATFARQMAMLADLKTMPHYDVDKKYGVSRGYSVRLARQINDQRKHREQLKFKF